MTTMMTMSTTTEIDDGNGQMMLIIKQGRIHGQKAVADGWAGAVCRWAGAVIQRAGAIFWVGRGFHAQKSLIRPISRCPNFRVTNIPRDTPSYRVA